MLINYELCTGMWAICRLTANTIIAHHREIHEIGHEIGHETYRQCINMHIYINI